MTCRELQDDPVVVIKGCRCPRDLVDKINEPQEAADLDVARLPRCLPLDFGKLVHALKADYMLRLFNLLRVERVESLCLWQLGGNPGLRLVLPQRLAGIGTEGLELIDLGHRKRLELSVLAVVVDSEATAAG